MKWKFPVMKFIVLFGNDSDGGIDLHLSNLRGFTFPILYFLISFRSYLIFKICFLF